MQLQQQQAPVSFSINRPLQYQPMAQVPQNAVVQYVMPSATNMALTTYQPQNIIPRQNYAPVIPYRAPPQDWLYNVEHDPNAELENEAIEQRKTLYIGSLWRPLMDEGYLCSHLSHQATVSSFADIGETMEFQSSTSKRNVLTVINVSADTTEIGWRILADNQTSYVIFRGSPDWRFPLYESKMVKLHDIAPKTTFRAHNLFLQELNVHMTSILASLQSNPTSRVVLAGHGNGGGFAILAHLLLLRAGYPRNNLATYSFGAPLVAAGNLETNYPLPQHIVSNIHNFVNEDDLIPSMLGQKDLHTVDQLIGKKDNPLKNGRHTVVDLKSYRPLGRFYHLKKNGAMTDIGKGKEKFFLDVSRGSPIFSIRINQHSADAYVKKLRQVVTDN